MPSIEKHVEISRQRTKQFYREIHDDLENFQRQIEVYDVRYAWCGLDIACSEEYRQARWKIPKP